MAAAIPYAIMAGSTLLSMSSQRKQAKQSQQAAALDAAQMERKAQAERAMSQRVALEERRQARLAQSALQARAGGGGADIVRMDADLEAEGEYRALSALYAGETGADSATYAANVRRQQGRDAAGASRYGQLGSLLSFGSKMYDAYGGGGFNAYAANDSGGYKPMPSTYGAA